MLETLKKLLVEELQLDPDTITMDAELSSDLGLNSIELANLVMLCEDQFDLRLVCRITENIDITLDELSETSLLRTVCTPYTAYLKCLERSCQVCAVVSVVSGKRKC